MDFKDLAAKVLDFAPLVGGALGGPPGAALGAGIKVIAGLFGVKSANPTADEIDTAMTADPEMALKLKQADYAFTLAMRQADKDEYLAELETIRGSQNVEVEESKSTDEYVRRTRPGILRKLFWLIAIYCFVAPGMVYLAAKGGMQDFNVDNLISMLTYIGGFLFSTFSIGYTGYNWMRTKEKLAENGGNGSKPGLLKALIGKK